MQKSKCTTFLNYYETVPEWGVQHYEITWTMNSKITSELYDAKSFNDSTAVELLRFNVLSGENR